MVLAPGAEGCTRDSLTLVPKAHAQALTDLSPDVMAAVLAGLSRLSLAVRQTCGLDDVEIQAHPTDASGRDAHVHFHPVLHDNLRAILGGGRGEREMGEKDVLAIAEAMAHGVGLRSTS